jgi:uncharacterized protein (DUF305 family)
MSRRRRGVDRDRRPGRLRIVHPVRTLVVSLAVAACSRAPTPAANAPPPATPRHTAADVHFMSGMIAHHAQAVRISRWAVDSIHGAGPAIRGMGERMLVSQADEIALIETWLSDRGAARMEHDMAMPGMLTPAQLAQLDVARGAEFDRLFLTFMIAHHRGALTMVDELLATAGAAQDGFVSQFAGDVYADQTAEIERMQRLLAALTFGGKTP